MPFFTQALTTQPSGPGSAARTSPSSRACRKASKVARASSPSDSAGSANRPSMLLGQPGAHAHAMSPRAASALLSASRVVSLGGHSGRRKRFLAQAQEGQRGLDRDRVRLDEVQVHELE